VVEEQLKYMQSVKL